MDFRDDANLDASQVEDVGGSGGGGGGGGGFPGGVVIGGGGIVSLIVLVLVFVLNNLSGGDSQPAQRQPSSNLSQQCRTGKDADQSEKCRVVGVVNSIQDYWKTQLSDYRPAKTVLYSGSLRTPCGAASSAVGPFYCPADRIVYLDMSFFNVMTQRLGAPGQFAQAYVVAHEVGHHVQNLLGISGKVDAARQRGSEAQANAMSVRLELQADCFAGVWAKRSQAVSTWRLEDGDIETALNAASQIGDDTLQRKSRGTVVPESFTHGTSAQRVGWFKRGFESGSPDNCNTFEARQL